MLQIETPLSWSSDYRLALGQTERLVDLCKQVGATEYLSGPAARAYLDEGLFAQEGIEVSYVDYSGYPEHPQLHPPFEHGVSILDLLFNAGPDAHRYMQSFAFPRGGRLTVWETDHESGARSNGGRGGLQLRANHRGARRPHE